MSHYIMVIFPIISGEGQIERKTFTRNKIFSFTMFHNTTFLEFGPVHVTALLNSITYLF